MDLFCVQVKAAEEYRDGTDASSDIKARARYTNGKARTSHVACAQPPVHCSVCLVHPAVLLFVHQQEA